MPAHTILVVEDEFLIRMMLAETLADDGHTVLEAGTAQEALDLLRDPGGVQLMLTDLNLPGGRDGLALAAQARQAGSTIPIIFLTGRPDAIGPDQLAPGDEVIAKPYLPSTIAAAVARLLG